MQPSQPAVKIHLESWYTTDGALGMLAGRSPLFIHVLQIFF